MNSGKSNTPSHEDLSPQGDAGHNPVLGGRRFVHRFDFRGMYGRLWPFVKQMVTFLLWLFLIVGCLVLYGLAIALAFPNGMPGTLS